MDIILDALRSTFTSIKKGSKSLHDYTIRFKMSTEILESHLGGPLILEKYMRTLEGYYKSIQTKQTQRSNNIWKIC